MSTKTATVLGKRKSRTSSRAAPAAAISDEEAQAIFRRAFEAKFLPLEGVAVAEREEEQKKEAVASSAGKSEQHVEDQDEEDSGYSDWSGLSEDEGGEKPDEDDESATAAAALVEVIEHKSIPTKTPTSIDKSLKKAYLSSRPPPSTNTPDTTKSTSNKKTKDNDEDEDSATLLKNDIALQRLLNESHLFKSTLSAGQDATTQHTGRNRHRATDLRLAALGSRESIYTQAKMPRAIRMGIEGAAATREAKRRREARENGIILEHPASSKKRKSGGGGGRRERPVDGPAVGRFNRGMLKLSNRDIREIQGPVDRGGGGKGKKRRR